MVAFLAIRENGCEAMSPATRCQDTLSTYGVRSFGSAGMHSLKSSELTALLEILYQSRTKSFWMEK
jgi:hypothetical protein